jgi:peptidoglycan biosynthesis protein MviN/MurJ (putative lipid II flippase)
VALLTVAHLFMSKPLANDQLKIYLDYLDKEITIMGILSTFCMVVQSVVADKLFGSKDGAVDFLNKAPFLCETALAGFVLAAFAFYRQRVQLTWFYGQLGLSQAKEDFDDVRTLLKDSDAWHSWRWCQAGFGFLAL